MNANPSFLEKFHWEKVLIWGLFLASIYVLRHFFLVVFMTFMVSYCMRSMVEFFLRKFPERSRTRFLNYVLTIACFLALLLTLYGVGSYIVPESIRQGQEFVKKVANPKKSAKAQFDDLLRDTVGKWLFSQHYGDRESPAYLEAFRRSGIYDQIEFEHQERAKLVGDWKKGEVAEKIETKIEESAIAGMSKVGSAAGELIPKLLYLPFELLLVLLLSFFITIDIPKMKAGLQRLRHSRVQKFYDEIAPGLISFGRLIGRAFQAQAIIAAVNAGLTYFFVIKLLGIQHGMFLAFLVFLCSFIPVVGVVISGLPITMIAITQEDGSFLIALWAIVGILAVHFLETSYLNPKILGNMLHLHPVLVLAILAISEHFFGIWGLLLGVPVAVYIIRFVILDEGIPGVIEPIRLPKHSTKS